MSKSLRNTLLLVVGLIFIAATIMIYLLLGFPKTPATNIGISFVLVSEVAFISYIIGMSFIPKGPNNLFSPVGIISGLTLYFFATVVLFAFSNNFNNNVNGLLIFEIIAFALTAVVVITIVYFSIKINHSDQKILNDRRFIQICEKRISDLLSVNKNKPCEPQLLIILEKLKYCDKIGSTSVDEKIVGSIIKLEKELNSSVPNPDNIFFELTALISQRNTEMADNKRGGF